MLCAVASLSIEALEKTLGDARILRGIDLEVKDGELVVLVGPSGCGKSTLLRSIAGLEAPNSGRIRIGSRDVTHLPPRDRDVAMVFQSYALYPHLTVRENLAFGLRLRGEASAAIDARIVEVSSMLGLDALLARYPRQLSGGQRQRVAMGRAIARRPALFLFDEPLSNLDAALRSEVRVEIKRLHARLGATMVYVTHDQVEAMTLADRLVVLNKGVVEQVGAPLEVYRRPRTRFVAAFLGSPAMNFIPVAFEGERARAKDLDIATAGLDIPAGTTRALLGVRPHDLVPREGGGIRMAVEVIERMGTEAFVHGRVGEVLFVARLDAAMAETVTAATTLELAVHEGAAHLFDPTSEAAL